MARGEVSVIIVNWNAGALLRACVASTLESPADPIVEIIVVDNASSDGSEELAANLPGVTLIRAGTNLGFAKASNLGARGARGEFLLFLNPDARLVPGTVAAVVRFMAGEEGRGVGICGVRLTDEDGSPQESHRRFPGAGTFVGKALGLAAIAPRWFAPGTIGRTSGPVDQVIGAFFFVRRELFEGLGGFDERFFMYFEEVDFSLRARDAGWLSYYLAEVSAFHRGGGSSSQVRAERLFYSWRSRILFAMKHFNRVEAVAVAIVTLLVEPVTRSLGALLSGSLQRMIETMRGFALLLRDAPRWMATARDHIAGGSEPAGSPEGPSPRE